jgi:hypothetical protein
LIRRSNSLRLGRARDHPSTFPHTSPHSRERKHQNRLPYHSPSYLRKHRRQYVQICLSQMLDCPSSYPHSRLRLAKSVCRSHHGTLLTTTQCS